MKTQLIFVLLQAADVASTMVVLQMGGTEKNPLLLHLMRLGALQGLLLSKVIVFGIGAGAVLVRKHSVLRWSNIVFTGIVLWNLAIIVRLVLHARFG